MDSSSPCILYPWNAKKSSCTSDAPFSLLSVYGIILKLDCLKAFWADHILLVFGSSHEGFDYNPPWICEAHLVPDQKWEVFLTPWITSPGAEMMRNENIES